MCTLPPRVEYEATPLGLSLQPAFERLLQWSEVHLDQVAKARRNFEALSQD
ncbi:winged helix-turn-helix transcriptional regulator [Cryobacterium roopkundense]|uniref:winged helix-turn-helix transcriptional regulator n=1 Tax=Cryobacterium roopkundense TaxID=1001240 RepID=UPI000A065FA8